MVFKDGTFFCQPIYVGCKDILSAIESTICIAKVINQQKNDVGLFVLAMGLHADAEESHQRKMS